MVFDSARESIKNQFQGLVFEVLSILDILKRVGFSNFFSFGKCISSAIFW